jgi:hypothetical protein
MQMIAGAIVVLAGAILFTASGFVDEGHDGVPMAGGFIIGIVGFAVLFGGISRENKNTPPKE